MCGLYAVDSEVQWIDSGFHFETIFYSAMGVLWESPCNIVQTMTVVCNVLFACSRMVCELGNCERGISQHDSAVYVRMMVVVCML